jgi:hypothetical protein
VVSVTDPSGRILGLRGVITSITVLAMSDYGKATSNLSPDSRSSG